MIIQLPYKYTQASTIQSTRNKWIHINTNNSSYTKSSQTKPNQTKPYSSSHEIGYAEWCLRSGFTKIMIINPTQSQTQSKLAAARWCQYSFVYLSVWVSDYVCRRSRVAVVCRMSVDCRCRNQFNSRNPRGEWNGMEWRGGGGRGIGTLFQSITLS